MLKLYGIKMLTTTEAAALLTERGITVKADTIKHWCQQGKFPNARRIGGPRRGSWLIPQSDLDAFTPPTMGRPKKV